jgi:trimethylamine:corrinoid methyltransferase-like protein
MASLLAGSSEAFLSRPFFTIVLCMVSPLVHPRIRVEELMECAKVGVPLTVEVDALPGATTPITLAGICLAQMVRPGLPASTPWSRRSWT